MCFLVLEHRVRASHPLVLLHNRDEAYDRPFDPPRLLDVPRGIVAPRDLEAGGSWLGTNRWGLVVAIANRHGEDVTEGVRSRGLVVLDVLRQKDAEAALEWVRDHLTRFAYAGFHLLLADGKQAILVRHRGASVPRPLAKEDTFQFLPGVYVVTNLHEPDEVGPPPTARPAAGESLEETFQRLAILARDAETVLPGDHRILKRGETRGTVASALLAPPRFLFAAGPPDRTEYRPVAPSFV